MVYGNPYSRGSYHKYLFWDKIHSQYERGTKMSIKFRSVNRREPGRRKEVTPSLRKSLEKGGVIKKWGKPDILIVGGKRT